ncbi:hypothetical protein GOQ04_25265 [Emticicia sp. ODNR4P]|nr:hypothetical protein [Emticicia sp. ODNR4P]
MLGQTLGCNFKPGTIQLNLSGQSIGTNIVSYVVLVDGGNIIRYKSLVNSGTIDAVGVGSYKAVAITWDNTQSSKPSLEIGKNLTEIDHCWKSTTIDLSICDCNTTTNSITVPSSEGPSPQYLLTDGKGVIQQVQRGTTFSNLGNGVYNHYVFCNINSNAIVGSKITTFPSTDFCRMAPLSYVVCLTECAPVICLPIAIRKTK